MKQKIKTSPRVIRGGSWTDNEPVSLATSARLRLDPTYWNCDLGLRLVRTA